MADRLAEYRERGWTLFPCEPAVLDWVRACAPMAEAVTTGEGAQPLRCGGTWQPGVNALPNDALGAIADADVPPLTGAAVDFCREALGLGDFSWDRAQISVVHPGYPRHGEEETEAAFRYRHNRRAAHVDGLERTMPGRRRKLSETHSFLIGLPLDEAGAARGAFTIWEGSHEVMRAAFREVFADAPPVRWREIDVTEAYVSARRRCFETCRMVEVAPPPGAAYVMHPLALHGVAPWRDREGAPPRAVAYFRPDAFGGDPAQWLEA